MAAPSTITDGSAPEAAPVYVLLTQGEYDDLAASRSEVTRLTSELESAHARIIAAERVAHDADEIARSLQIGQFRCSGLVPVGESDGTENVWIRIRSTANGIERICAHIARLDERARTAEAALERADAAARRFGRDEFEWQDSIPVDEANGERVMVRVLGTEGGIAKINAFIARLKGRRDELYEAWVGADDRADAAKDKLEAIRAAAPSVADSHAKAVAERNAANARADAAEVRLQVAEDKFYAVEDAVRSYFNFTRSVERLQATASVDPLSDGEVFRRAVRVGV